MRVVSLQIRDFRSYARAEARLGDGLTVVHGANGEGKSNLLEAIFFGCTATSYRARNEREMVRFGARAMRVAVAVEDDGYTHELSVGYATEPGFARPVKRVMCDGAVVERLLDLEQRPLLGVFLPDRLELLKGSPGLRRAHLDRFVAAVWPLRAGAQREYSRVLAQRNALLAGIRAGRASHASLSAWDRELAGAAVRLSGNRAAAVGLLEEPFAERAQRLGCSGAVQLEYRPRAHARGETEFLAELQARLPADLERGFCTYGPHRDELAILRDGRELRLYGSQGEQRLALLALLLAERAVLARERDRTPLMLLDDVMSELDAHRRELLAGELASGGQSVIAATELGHVPGASDASVTRLRVRAGAILGEAVAA